MADELDDFALGYTGSGSGAGEWMTAPENCHA